MQVLSDLHDGVVYGVDMENHKTNKQTFARTRFLAATILSSPVVAFVYSPLLIVLTAVGIAVPFATGRFIDSLVAGASPVAPFAVLATLLIVRAAMTPFLQGLVLSRARNIELRLYENILDATMDFSPSELSPQADGTLVAKLTRDVSAVGGFVYSLYPRLVTALVTMFAAGFALHTRSSALGLSFMAFIPACIVLFIPFARRFASNSRNVRKKSDRAFAALFDFFRSLPFLHALDAERRFADSSRSAMRGLNDGNRAVDRLTVMFGALLAAIMVAGEVSVLGTAGMLAAKGAIPVGDVVVYQMLFISAMQSVQGIVSLLPETATLREGIDSIGEILDHAPPKRGDKRIENIESVEFRNVSFAYPGAGVKNAVSNFSAAFRAGRIAALIGANGAGKTTLLKLATAALEPQSGEILVNGSPVQSLDTGAFRRQIGIVFQDSLLVTGTIRDNITLRDPAFTEKNIEDALSLSGMDEVVERLPNGLDTCVGLDGQSLSGGEMQRLAIARALVRDPGILVLDEVTNHLDADARAAFGELLRRLAPGRIVLVVSHDPSLTNLCDEKIYCQIPK